LPSNRLALLLFAILHASPAAALPSTEFGSQAVGSPVSNSVAISLTIAQLQAGVTFSFHYGTDFSAGSCVPASGGCQLAVTFRPTLPGSRSDVVIVKSASGTILGKVMVHGTGLGPMLQFNPGTSKLLYAPAAYGAVHSVAVDGSGNIFFLSGTYYQQLMKLAPGATTPQTIVSSPVVDGLRGLVGVDGAGNVYYADTQGIEEIDADTGVTTLVTNAIASLSAVDIYGNLYAIGQSSQSPTVQRFDRTTGVLATIAGSGTVQGDGGPAVDAALSGPVLAVTVDPAGNLYISEWRGRIRKVDASTQIITTIAGNDTTTNTGDGGPASAAEVAQCASLATDAVGNLYLATENLVIRKIDASTGIISTVAGTAQLNGLETGELTNTVQIVFSELDSFTVDSMGNLFATISDANGLYEFNFESPALPFTAPGSGPNPSLVESLLSVGNQPLALGPITVSGPFTLQTSATLPCGSAITLAVGSSCRTVVAYNASSSSQTGTLTVTGNMGNVANSTQQAALSLIYPQAILETSEGNTSSFSGLLSFGSGYVGGFGGNQWLNIYNPGIATLQVSSITFTGPGAASFTVDTLGSNCSGTIGPESYCSMDVLFEPVAAGVLNATMVINSNNAQPLTAAVTGTATLPGILTPSQSQITFTLPASGAASTPQTITFLNTGGASVGFFPFFYYSTSPTITTVSNSCNGISSLAPGASCSITLQAAAGTTPSTWLLVVYYSNQTIQENFQLDIPIITVAATPPAPLNFVPVAPCRVADTRNATGAFGGPFIAGGSTRSFTIPSSACNIPSTAAAYSLNVAVVPHGPLGYLTAYAAGQQQPDASTLNSQDGRIKSTAAIVPAGTSGAASFYASNDTDLVLDINGYFVPSSSSTGLNYYALSPCRVADTRNADGALGGPFLTASQERDFPVQLSSCSVPSQAQAYSINIAAVPLTGELGYLTLWPAGESQPTVASLNAPTGAVTSNAALLPAGTSGDIAMLASNNTQAIIDINGYFAPATSSGLHFYAVTPCRALDTRTVGTGQPFTGTLTVMMGGFCGIPSNASAVVVNATVVPSGPLGYLTLWADGQTQPVVATLNASDGAITSNMAIVPMADGIIDAFASNSTHLIVDVSGYFAP